jgi:hypothetical protein
MALELDAFMNQRDIRRAVGALIRAGKHPHRDDIAAALAEIPGEPVPQTLVDYVCRVYVTEKRLRATGRRPRAHASAREVLIPLYYRLLCAELQESEQTKEVRGHAIKATAREHGVSVSTVKRLIANSNARRARLRISPQ